MEKRPGEEAGVLRALHPFNSQLFCTAQQLGGWRSRNACKPALHSAARAGGSVCEDTGSSPAISRYLPVPIPQRSSKSFAGLNPRLPAFRSPAGPLLRSTRFWLDVERDPRRRGPRPVGPPPPHIVSRSRSGPAPRRRTTFPGGSRHRATGPAWRGGSRRSARRGAIRPRQVAREGGRGPGWRRGAAGCPPSGGRCAALPAVPVEEPREKGTPREGSSRSGMSGRSVQRCGAAPNVANGALISVQVPKEKAFGKQCSLSLRRAPVCL